MILQAGSEDWLVWVAVPADLGPVVQHFNVVS